MSDDEGFKINSAYAKKYNDWREKEELQKLKDRYGDVGENDPTDSSSSESEDEDGEALTAKDEKNWFRALSALKCKDPKIYDKSVDFFKSSESSDTEDSSPKAGTSKKVKPMFLKDYEREVILKKGGVIESEDSEEEEENELKAIRKPGYFEEQAAIKKSFESAVQSDDSESEDGFLTRRSKTIQEEEQEEEEYVDWLKGQKETISDEEEIGIELNSLKDYWSNPKLDSGERFLRDYILNKRYKEDEDSNRPSYDDIIGADEEDLSADEETIEKQETFERKYNFRYEEPDEEFIKSYPRTIGESVRRKENKRVDKRQEVKERKQKEKEKKKEEIKQLKKLKRKQIMGKLDQLKEITGNPELDFTEEDLEHDFDPKKHDEMMQKAFDEDYYDMDVDADGKPVFSDMDEDEEIEDWDKWTGPTGEEESYEPHCEDPDFVMDADYDPSQVPPQKGKKSIESTSSKKRRSKFKEAVETKKPEFDPNEKTFEEYFNEYYKLDYEDIIGDTPCRFKYRNVESNDFGLSTEEVLTAKDKELNAWVSLKKMSMYQTQEEELFEKKIYQKKGRNQTKKLNIMPTLAQTENEGDVIEDDVNEEPEDTEEPQPSTSGTSTGNTKKTRKRKKKKGKRGTNDSQANTALPASPNKSNQPKKRKLDGEETSVKGFKKAKLNDSVTVSSVKGPVNLNKKKRKRKPKSSAMSDERLKAYGIDPKKYKYTQGKNKSQKVP